MSITGDKFQDMIDNLVKKKRRQDQSKQHPPIRQMPRIRRTCRCCNGKSLSTNIDFGLPGPIPLVWERIYYSDAEAETPLGYNWH
jgi:hypothetical protein